jgi:hypothetical protein
MVFGFFILILITLFNYVKTSIAGGGMFPRLTGVNATVDSDIQLLFDHNEARFDIIVHIKPVRKDLITEDIKEILNTLRTHGYTLDTAQQSLPEYIKDIGLLALDPKGMEAKGKTLIIIREPFVEQRDAINISKRVLATGFDDIMNVISNNPTLVNHLNNMDKIKKNQLTDRRGRGRRNNRRNAENMKLQNKIDNQAKQIANLKAQPTRPTNDMPRSRRVRPVRPVIEENPTDDNRVTVIKEDLNPPRPTNDMGRRRDRSVIEPQQPKIDVSWGVIPPFKQPTRPTDDMTRSRRVRSVIDEQWGDIPPFKQPTRPANEVVGHRRVRAVIEPQQPLDNLDSELKMRPTFPTVSNGIKEPRNRPTTS